jgi:Uma2 family endonuclease
MAIIAEKTNRFSRIPKSKIPPSLVYEIIDGRNIYYRGYRDVIAQTKTPEEIMGTSGLQAIIMMYIVEVLLLNLNKQKYRITGGESGVHIDHRNNLAHDIAVYDKTILTADKITTKYIDVPSVLAIEIDIKADLSLKDDYDYVHSKTQKLLDFGTQKVVWIFSNTQKVMIAEIGKDWRIVDWKKDVELIDNVCFNIGNYLKEEGIKL